MFKPSPFTDARLGELLRKGGIWRGTIVLGGIDVPLAIHGPREAPDPQALAIACAVSADYPAWQPSIAAALLEHYAPYADAVASEESAATEAVPPRIARPEEVWNHAAIQFVAVVPLEGEPTVEIGYRVAWDEEHVLGARLKHGRLVELNGSVLPP